MKIKFAMYNDRGISYGVFTLMPESLYNYLSFFVVHDLQIIFVSLSSLQKLHFEIAKLREC